MLSMVVPALGCCGLLLLSGLLPLAGLLLAQAGGAVRFGPFGALALPECLALAVPAATLALLLAAPVVLALESRGASARGLAEALLAGAVAQLLMPGLAGAAVLQGLAGAGVARAGLAGALAGAAGLGLLVLPVVLGFGCTAVGQAPPGAARALASLGASPARLLGVLALRRVAGALALGWLAALVLAGGQAWLGSRLGLADSPWLLPPLLVLPALVATASPALVAGVLVPRLLLGRAP